MDKADMILKKILSLAKEDERIRGLVLVGSRALSSSDNLSDFDISIFVNNIEEFVNSDSWIKKVANVWVYEPEKYNWDEIEVPTRLVIYEGGIKVDYSLWNISIAEKVGQSDFYDSGYKVLLDKDGILATFKNASLKPTIQKKPSEQEFIKIIHEFWFEAYHVAKYLKREDLWLVKFRHWSLQVYLLTMLEWYMLAKNNWNNDVKWTGKQIKEWLDPEIYKRLNNIFSHFDKEDSSKGLIEIINLFRDVSKETAKNLNYNYPEDVDNNLTKFISELQQS